MKNNGFERLVAFLNKLEKRGISYTLAHHRDEAIMVIVAVPGERWEVEFLGDGAVEVERFTSPIFRTPEKGCGVVVKCPKN